MKPLYHQPAPPGRVRGGLGRALHRSQRAREVGPGLAGDPGQRVERARRLLGDDAQLVVVASGQRLGERHGGGEPDLQFLGRDTALASAMVRACLHGR